MWTQGNGRVYTPRGQASGTPALVSKSRTMRANVCPLGPTCGAFRWLPKTARTRDPQEEVPEMAGTSLPGHCPWTEPTSNTGSFFSSLPSLPPPPSLSTDEPRVTHNQGDKQSKQPRFLLLTIDTHSPFPSGSQGREPPMERPPDEDRTGTQSMLKLWASLGGLQAQWECSPRPGHRTHTQSEHEAAISRQLFHPRPSGQAGKGTANP